MANKPIVVVTGVTGAQGGSVAEALLHSGKWHVRGITRKPDSDKAKEWAKKGVEIVKADLSNKAELEKAFRGGVAAFGVTNFWDPEVQKNISLEVTQGKLMADVAAAAGVKHYVWSSLPNADKISGGKLHVPHLTGKNEVEEYIRTKHKSMTMTAVYMGFYWTNLRPNSRSVRKSETDGAIEFILPLNPTTQIPGVDPADLGPIVATVLENREKYAGKRILVAAEYITPPEIAKIFTKVTGKPARCVAPPFDVLAKSGMSQELIEMFKFFNDYGTFNKEDISEAKKINPKMKGWEEWLYVSGWLQSL
jgi:uncharacterized protein YbjT (DUF2867 family)